MKLFEWLWGTYDVAACIYEWLCIFVCCFRAFFDWNQLFLYFWRYRKSCHCYFLSLLHSLLLIIDTWTWEYLHLIYFDAIVCWFAFPIYKSLIFFVSIFEFFFLFILLLLFEISFFLFGNDWQCLLLFCSISFLLLSVVSFCYKSSWLVNEYNLMPRWR